MMAVFDTSVVVAALIGTHKHHARAIPWFEAVRAGKLSGRVSWHGAAEAWAVLTRLPGGQSVPGAFAEQMIERLVKVLRPLPLGARAYKAAIRRCAARGLSSGAVFDALHLATAEVARADLLLTFNEADFLRLSEGAGPRILVPPDPPAARW